MNTAEEQAVRQVLLDSLYFSSGRNDPSHPMHGLYTGLMEAERRRQGVKDQFLAWWAQSYAFPPGVHAVNTHVSFGQYLLEKSC